VYETDKLSEAGYFLERMAEAEARGDRVALKNCLSAFLSASRSVLQYAHVEAAAKSQLPWYEKAVVADSCIAFLRDERNTNIHERPAAPVEVTSVEQGGRLGFAGALDAVVRNRDGALKEARALSSTTASPGVEAATTVTSEFFFLNWAGAETAVALCRRYLRALEAVVKDGRARGILTDHRSYR
jgi:hypothetical protein